MELPAFLSVVGIALGCAALLNAGARLAWALLGSALAFALLAGDPFRVGLAARHFVAAATAADWRLVPLLCWLAVLLDQLGTPRLARASAGAVVLALLANALALPWLDLVVACAIPLLAAELLRVLWYRMRDMQRGRAEPGVPLRGAWPLLALGLGLVLAWSGRAEPAESAAAAAIAVSGGAWLWGGLDAAGLERSAARALRRCGAIAAVWLAALCFEAALRDAGVESLGNDALALLRAGPTEVALGVLVAALACGAVFRASEVVLVLVPLTAPLAAQVGVDRLWLGAGVALALHASARPVSFGSGSRTAPGAVRLAFPSLVAAAMFRWPELVHWLPELVLS